MVASSWTNSTMSALVRAPSYSEKRTHTQIEFPADPLGSQTAAQWRRDEYPLVRGVIVLTKDTIHNGRCHRAWHRGPVRRDSREDGRLVGRRTRGACADRERTRRARAGAQGEAEQCADCAAGALRRASQQREYRSVVHRRRVSPAQAAAATHGERAVSVQPTLLLFPLRSALYPPRLTHSSRICGRRLRVRRARCSRFSRR